MKITMPEFSLPKLPLPDQFHHPYLKQVPRAKVKRIDEEYRRHVKEVFLLDKHLGDISAALKYNGFYYLPTFRPDGSWTRVKAPEGMMNDLHRVSWSQRYLEVDLVNSTLEDSVGEISRLRE